MPRVLPPPLPFFPPPLSLSLSRARARCTRADNCYRRIKSVDKIDIKLVGAPPSSLSLSLLAPDIGRESLLLSLLTRPWGAGITSIFRNVSTSRRNDDGRLKGIFYARAPSRFSRAAFLRGSALPSFLPPPPPPLSLSLSFSLFFFYRRKMFYCRDTTLADHH